MTKHEIKALKLSNAYEQARENYCSYMLEMWKIKGNVTKSALDGNGYFFTYNGTSYDVHFDDVMRIVEFCIPFNVFNKWQEHQRKVGNTDLLFYLAFVLDYKAGASVVKQAEKLIP